MISDSDLTMRALHEEGDIFKSRAAMNIKIQSATTPTISVHATYIGAKILGLLHINTRQSYIHVHPSRYPLHTHTQKSRSVDAGMRF